MLFAKRSPCRQWFLAVCLAALTAGAGEVGFSVATLAAPAEPVARAGEPAATPGEADGLIASPEPDWPQWRGKRRDGIADEKGLLPTWPEGGPPLVWKYDRLGRGWSSPIVVGDRLYITGDVQGDLVIYAFDLAGRLQWQVTNGKAWEGSYPGARASCAYSQGRLYQSYERARSGGVF